MNESNQHFRPEADVFNDLAELAISPGYAHVIAALCLRSNIVFFNEELNAEDLIHRYSEEHLVHTEISTLIGLMIKGDINIEAPKKDSLIEMIERTDKLLRELHHSICSSTVSQAEENMLELSFTERDILREVIFYSAESAYPFQYRDLARKRYSRDCDWLLSKNGFTIDDACAVIDSITKIQNNNLEKYAGNLQGISTIIFEPLHVFIFSLQEIEDITKLSMEKIRNVINAFSIKETDSNSDFQSISDFNIANSNPIIPTSDKDKYIAFQIYSTTESLYDSPFYWMIKDRNYSSIASSHRGEFLEGFCFECMVRIFTPKRVFKNVIIKDGKETIGEIDVLAVWGDRVVIIQAKSKKLTIEARKGNDNKLKEDFSKSIGDTYDQGFSCAEALLNPNEFSLTSQGVSISLDHAPKEIFIVCVISEHYPALALQTMHLLDINPHKIISPPFVIDVFTLDVLVEMLDNPLYFLSYVNRRVNYTNQILYSHELTVLSYHLKMNLWIDSDSTLLQLHDSVASDLDAAMAVRRDGLPGERTPDGILTKFLNTWVGNIIRSISSVSNSEIINLGFLLLELNEETISKLNEGINGILNQTNSDEQSHNLSMLFGRNGSGITIHTNFLPDDEAIDSLGDHSTLRKYSFRASTWYGLCLSPTDGSIRFVVKLDYPWEQSDEMDERMKDLPKGSKKLNLKTRHRKSRKIGRNDPCPCGSGIKYKKCCLNREV